MAEAVKIIDKSVLDSFKGMLEEAITRVNALIEKIAAQYWLEDFTVTVTLGKEPLKGEIKFNLKKRKEGP